MLKSVFGQLMFCMTETRTKNKIILKDIVRRRAVPQTSQKIVDPWIHPEADSLPGGRSEAMLVFFVENPGFNITAIFADLKVEQYMHKIHNFSKK